MSTTETMTEIALKTAIETETAAIRFHALDRDYVASIRSGAPDAYGAPAERGVSDGGKYPCRSCLKDIPKGEEMLLLAHRPFPEMQPYAETGPIFLCAECAPHEASAAPPPVVETRKTFIVKGYGADDRIVYGTGQVTATEDLPAYCADLLARAEIAYVDLRSAVNNCFICRVKRA